MNWTEEEYKAFLEKQGNAQKRPTAKANKSKVISPTIQNKPVPQSQRMSDGILNFTIPLTPISKKNSQQILTNPKTKRPFIMPSKQYKQYEKDCAKFLPKVESPIDFPVNIKCLYFMPTKRKCDLTNLMESTHDIMVHCGILSDDNYSIVETVDGSQIFYDKENPRTEVIITRKESNDT